MTFAFEKGLLRDVLQGFVVFVEYSIMNFLVFWIILCRPAKTNSFLSCLRRCLVVRINRSDVSLCLIPFFSLETVNRHSKFLYFASICLNHALICKVIGPGPRCGVVNILNRIVKKVVRYSRRHAVILIPQGFFYVIQSIRRMDFDCVPRNAVFGIILKRFVDRCWLHTNIFYTFFRSFFLVDTADVIMTFVLSFFLLRRDLPVDKLDVIETVHSRGLPFV